MYVINQMYHTCALLSPSNFSSVASVPCALPTMVPREGEDPGIRVHRVDFGEVLAKIQEMGRFLLQAGLLNSSQLSKAVSPK